MKVLLVAAARPNFMKVAPIARELAARPKSFDLMLVHTGQHYDDGMSQVFFDDLGIPEPDVRLGVGSGSHAEQTARIMLAFEPVLLDRRPDVVVVVGDVNSTLACALVAAKLHVPVAHVEAGLRSFDRTMPEETNRVLTDQIAEWLFTTEASAQANLLREGVPRERIHFVGNVMIDTLFRQRERALAQPLPFGISANGYALLTLHRPTNVDDYSSLARIVDALEVLQRRVPIVFPVHPRTARRLRDLGLEERCASLPALRRVDPLRYLDFLNLMARARVVLTDSGGIQEETTILGVPCVTLRENTERPVTVTEGTNTLVGSDPDRIVSEVAAILEGRGKTGRAPELWDGQAARRIVGILEAGI